jgi:hypothetical protein
MMAVRLRKDRAPGHIPVHRVRHFPQPPASPVPALPVGKHASMFRV